MFRFLKYIIAILLVSSFLFQNISKLIIVVNFQINREFIAKNLCVNRNKPKSCCKGKCELKKQLDEEDKKENFPAAAFKDQYEKQNYYRPALSVFAISEIGNQSQFTYIDQCGRLVSSGLFHPPPFFS